MAKKKTTKKKSAVENAQEPIPALSFHYIKNQSYRVVHVDGFHGGASPNNKYVHMAIFNERIPIPQEELYALKPTGELGERLEQTTRNGVVRQVESSLIMSKETAERLQGWLTTVLERMNERDEQRAQVKKAKKRTTKKKR